MVLTLSTPQAALRANGILSKRSDLRRSGRLFGHRAHHKRLRTSNLLERTFGELKRRTKVIPHFFTEQAAIKLSFAVLLATASKWRGVRMDVFTIRRIEELRNEFLPKSTSEEPAA